MNGDEMVYHDEDYYDETAMFDGYEEGTEFIEVNGQFVPHSTNQRGQPSSSIGSRMNATGVVNVKQDPLETTQPHRVYIPPPRPVQRKLFQPGPSVPSSSQYDSRPESPTFYRVQAKSSAARKSGGAEMGAPEQRRAFIEMKEQVNQVRMKTKKKVYAPGQRKPCNCTKSQCLKLYCDCFANGEFCRDCNCKDCHNNIDYDSQRSKAIRQSLERNPNAFKPKIGIARGGTADIERLHQKGCHCKKSGCLKNYCECYEAKVPCTERCKCKGCQNTETYRMNRYKNSGAGSNALMSLTNASSASTPDSGPGSVITDDMTDDYDDMLLPQKPKAELDPRRFPWYYMTDEVVEAATMCMVAQAEEALTSNAVKVTEDERTINMERLVLREFGRCLEQMIQNTNEATINLKTEPVCLPGTSSNT